MTASMRGLYEILVTEALASGLRQLDTHLSARTEGLRSAEAADRIALHVARIVGRAIADVPDEERVAVGVRLARAIVELIDQTITRADVLPEGIVEPAAVLHAIAAHLPDGTPETIPEPLIPRSRSTRRAGSSRRRRAIAIMPSAGS